MIELNKVSKSFHNFNPIFFNYSSSTEILKDVSFNILEGDIVGLIGKNGSGKSTLLKLLFGSLEPDKGDIFFKKSDLLYQEEMKNFSLINNNERSFFWRLTLKENLEYFQSIGDSYNEKIIEMLMEDLSVDKFLNKPFFALSSGEKKKALLYRGLLKDPKVIFFDEFTQSLDLPSKKQIVNFVKSLQLEFNKTILWVTHDMDEAFNLCNKLLLIEKKNVHEIDVKNISKDSLESLLLAK